MISRKPPTFCLQIKGYVIEMTRPELENLRFEIDAQLASDSEGNPQTVIDVACSYFGCTKHEFLTAGRSQVEAHRRFHVMRVLHDWPCSLLEIGRLLPRNGEPRDHSGISHGLRMHRMLCETDKSFRLDYENFLKRISGLRCSNRLVKTAC